MKKTDSTECLHGGGTERLSCTESRGVNVTLLHGPWRDDKKLISQSTKQHWVHSFI